MYITQDSIGHISLGILNSAVSNIVGKWQSVTQKVNGMSSLWWTWYNDDHGEESIFSVCHDVFLFWMIIGFKPSLSFHFIWDQLLSNETYADENGVLKEKILHIRWLFNPKCFSEKCLFGKEIVYIVPYWKIILKVPYWKNILKCLIGGITCEYNISF